MNGLAAAKAGNSNRGTFLLHRPELIALLMKGIRSWNPQPLNGATPLSILVHPCSPVVSPSLTYSRRRRPHETPVLPQTETTQREEGDARCGSGSGRGAACLFLSLTEWDSSLGVQRRPKWAGGKRGKEKVHVSMGKDCHILWDCYYT